MERLGSYAEAGAGEQYNKRGKGEEVFHRLATAFSMGARLRFATNRAMAANSKSRKVQRGPLQAPFK